MQLPPIKRLTREDLKDAPTWVDRLLYPLNLFLDTVYGGLNKGITFKENILSQQQTFTLIAGAAATNNTAKFIVTMKAKPTFILMLAIPATGDSFSPSTFTWNYDGTNVNITSITGLTNGVTYSITTLLF